MTRILITAAAIGLTIGGAALLNGTSASADHPTDLDCNTGDFPSQAAAQAHYRLHPGDPDDLDRDRDGVACEDLLPSPNDFTPITLAPQAPTAVATVPATPTATSVVQQQSICDMATQLAVGGSVVAFDRIAVTLPTGAGSFGVAFQQGNPTAILICHTSGRSGIAINAVTGQEIRRELTQTSSASVLDRIAASAGARGTTSSPSANRISAPNTGDAGLR